MSHIYSVRTGLERSQLSSIVKALDGEAFEKWTYHDTDIPYVDAVAPFHFEEHLRSFIDFGLNVPSMDFPDPGLAKIAEYRFTPQSIFRGAKLTRRVYRAVSVNNLPGRWVILFSLLEVYEHGFVVDGKHDIGCFDVWMRSEPNKHWALKDDEADRIFWHTGVNHVGHIVKEFKGTK